MFVHICSAVYVFISQHESLVFTLRFKPPHVTLNIQVGIMLNLFFFDGLKVVKFEYCKLSVSERSKQPSFGAGLY